MQLIIRDGQVSGYGEGLIDVSNGETIETSVADLAAVFEQAKEDGKTLTGPDETIDVAIENPLDYIDFLHLDSNGNVAFDDGYSRDEDK